MKIIVLADIHGDLDGVKKVKEFMKENEIEAAIILGDFPPYNIFRDKEASLKFAKEILSELSSFRVFAIPGNCDPREIVDLLSSMGVNLHNKKEELNGVEIVGYGGSSITPFSTPFEMEEDELYINLKSLVQKVKSEKWILALHTPPYNTKCDIIKDGSHKGSKAVRKIIEEFQPSVALCSHIHESCGKLDKIKESVVANIGPLFNGRVGILTIENKNIDIELKKIF